MPYVKLLVEPKDPSKIVPKENSTGKVDFYNVEPVENVLIGQVLGVQVDEKEDKGLFLEGTPSDIAGENTTVSKDGKSLVSLVNGYVVIEEGKLCVKDTLVVENVDFSTGNITFVGTLVVKDSIRKGFSVVANRIVVHNNIEDAHVKATGDVFVKGGIIGAKSHGIECFSSLEVGYIQESLVAVRGNVHVKKGIFNSTVLSGGSILVDGDVIGGVLKAKDMIVAKRIGQHSEFTSPVEIYLGRDPIVERDLKDVESKIKILEEKIDELEKMCSYLSSKGSLSPREEVELIKSKKELSNLRRILEKRSKELITLLSKFKKVNPKAYLRVSGVVEDKTMVFIGDEGIEFQNSKENVRVYMKEGKIKVEEIGRKD